MTHSHYQDHEGPGGPDVSADLVTTAIDYEQCSGRSWHHRILIYWEVHGTYKLLLPRLLILLIAVALMDRVGGTDL